MARRTPRILTALAATLLPVTTVACGSDEAPESLVIVDEWTEPAAAGADTILHWTVSSPGDDAIVAVDVAGSVADAATMRDPDGAPVDRIEIDGGGGFSLNPGSFHVSLDGLTEALEDGDRFELTVEFEDAGEQFVVFTVGDGPPFS